MSTVKGKRIMTQGELSYNLCKELNIQSIAIQTKESIIHLTDKIKSEVSSLDSQLDEYKILLDKIKEEEAKYKYFRDVEVQE